jgi:hypothetical protein
MNEPKPSSPRGPKLVPPRGAEPSTPAESSLFGAHTAPEEPRTWMPLLLGFGVVLAVVAAIVLFGRGRREVATSADPYSPKLVVQEARISQASNFVGATVTYIDLTTRNTGDRTVVGGLVQAIFRDSLGQPVQVETLPLRALLPQALGGEQEAAELARAPLGPGQTRVLRLTVEHISAQWNQAQPEIEFRALQFK